MESRSKRHFAWSRLDSGTARIRMAAGDICPEHPTGGQESAALDFMDPWDP
jgi:hypothetical protein